MPHDGHGHGHPDPASLSDRRLVVAVAINVALTAAQIVGGILSGSLALIADAVHNLSDAASLAIALVARRIARRSADPVMTFGYRRAETVAALVNLTTLIVIGVYLIFEAVFRFLDPQPIAGWAVVIIAGIALVVDAGTVWLTHRMARESANVRAAFLHNLADAMASVGVIVAGTLILLQGWLWVDAAVTLLIAGYVLWHGIKEIGPTVRILMGGAPAGLDAHAAAEVIRSVDGIVDVHHIHLWSIDEHRASLEAHLVVATAAPAEVETIKQAVRQRLSDALGIGHTTLETEPADADTGCGESAIVVGH